MKPAEVYIINQPEEIRDILLNLQIVIEHTIPQLEIFFKWKIPFYYFNGKPFCYLNVNKKKKYVDLGFVKGFQLQLHHELLISEGRNTMKSLRYFSVEEIKSVVIRDLLLEQMQLL